MSEINIDDSLQNKLNLENIAEEENNILPSSTEDDVVKEENTILPSSTKDDVSEEKPEWEDLLGSGSIMKKTIHSGTPDTRPVRLDTCHIKLKISLEDDSIVESYDDLLINLGDLDVVQGLDLSIGMMHVGERCILKIVPRLAYGSKGLEPVIPPETTVVFDVELLSVEPETPIENMPVNQRKVFGNKKRKRGNWWYGRGESNLAIQCYRRALDYLDEVEGGIKDPLPDDVEETSDAALQELLEDRVNVHNNMAAAQIKLELYDAALLSVDAVLRCQPNNVKALYRKATILKAKIDIPGALALLRKANSIEPDDTQVQREIQRLNAIIAKQKISERELARRMLNSGKEVHNKVPKTGSAVNSKVWVISIAASFAVAMLSLVVYRTRFN